MSTGTLTKNRYSQPQTPSDVVATSYRYCRDTLTAFTGYTFRDYNQAAHLVNLDYTLEAVERGELKRVIIAMPPRHGKSEKVSVRFPAWYLGRNPDKRVVISSYAADLAVRFSRQVRAVVQSEKYTGLFSGVQLAQDSRSAEQWDIAGRRGGLKAVGVGGPLTGHGANCFVAGTQVATSLGPVSIEDLQFAPVSCKIVSYGNGEIELKELQAFSRREGVGIYRVTTSEGRMVEATRDHRFWTLRGYVEARELTSSDTLLCFVPDGVHNSGVRLPEAPATGQSGLVLLNRMRADASFDKEPQAVRCLPESGSQEDAEVLRGVPTSETGTKGNPSDSESGLPDVQYAISVEMARKGIRGLLRKGLRQPGTFAVNGWQAQPEVEEWRDTAEATAAFRKGVSNDKAGHPGARWARLRSMSGNDEVARASYRQLADEQRGVQSGNALRDVPPEVAPGVRGEVSFEPVAMVERVRESATVYDIQVADNHNFFANGILVHNCLVIDDPIKNREEANSALIRQNVWDWYTSTAYTRLEDGGAVVVCMTRWHEDDLVGRLLEAQQEPTADQWHVVHMPAIDDTGAALWPEKYDLAALESIRANIGEYDWNALYQGRPTPREGSFFKVAQVGIVDVAPAGLRACRGWDLAATEGAGDYTAGIKLEGPDAEGIWYWTDMSYGRWDASTVRQTIRQTAEIDGRGVIIRLPQDPGQAGKDQARQLITMLSGFSVRSMPVSGSKEVRAAGFASQVNAGNVKMVKGPWNRFALDCLRSFPLGAVDDPIDAVSDAFNELTAKRQGQIAGPLQPLGGG